MKIPQDAIIPLEKLTKYLLVFRPENDKSKYLALAGFTLENPEALETAIRMLITSNDAVHDRSDVYGDYYQVSGELIGVNGRIIGVVTVWILRAYADNKYRFVTLMPRKRGKHEPRIIHKSPDQS